MYEFIDETSTENGTPINRMALMAVQGYQREDVVFGVSSIVKNYPNGHVETISFSDDEIIKEFIGEKEIRQRITFTESGYLKELI